MTETYLTIRKHINYMAEWPCLRCLRYIQSYATTIGSIKISIFDTS